MTDLFATLTPIGETTMARPDDNEVVTMNLVEKRSFYGKNTGK
jgi:hypothetical protein